MSDWSTAWSGAREGIIAGSQLAEQRRARKVQEGFEGTRVGIEGEKLGLDKQRLNSELELADLEKKVRAARLANITKAPDPGMTPVESTQGPEGTTTKYSPTNPVVSPTFKVGLNQGVTVNGQTHFGMDPAMLDFGSPAGGGPLPSAPAGSADQAGPSPAPGQPTTPAKGPGDGVTVRRRLTGLGPNGPSFGFTYEFQDPTKPHIASIQREGVPFAEDFQQVVNPENGSMSLHPLPSDAKGKLTEKQQTLAQLMTSRRLINQLEKTFKRTGNWVNPLSNTPEGWEDYQTLRSVPVQLSMSLARAMNPGAVAREGQVEMDRKYLIPVPSPWKPWSVYNDETAAGIKHLKHDVESRVQEMGLSKDLEAYEKEHPDIPTFPDEDSAKAALKIKKIEPGQPIFIKGKNDGKPVKARPLTP